MTSPRLEGGRDSRSLQQNRVPRAFNYPPRAAPTYRSPKEEEALIGGTRAWIGVAIAFTTFFLTGGLTRSFGVIYINILETYPKSNYALVALAPACLTTSVLCFGLFTGRLNSFLPLRFIAFFGYLLSGLALMLVYFAPSLVYFILCFIVAGIGMSQSQMSTLLNVMIHFKKKRSLATGISLSGISVGSIFSPPIIHVITMYYGFQIALASWGGLIIVLSPFVLLSRPPHWLKWVGFKKRQKSMRSSSRYLTRESFSTYVQQPTELWDRMAPPLQEIKEDDSTETEEQLQIAPDQLIKKQTTTESNDRKTDGHDKKDTNLRSKQAIDLNQPSTSKTTSTANMPGTSKEIRETSFNHRSDENIESVSDDDDEVEEKYDEEPYYWSEAQEAAKRQKEFDGLEPKPSDSKGDILLRHFRIKSEGRYSYAEPEVESPVMLWFKHNLRLDFSLFHHPVFTIMFFTAMFGMAGYPVALIFFTPFSLEHQTNGILASLLISISAVGDLIGRGFCSWLFDLKYFPKQILFTVSIMSISLALFFPVITYSYDPLACATFLYGISGGLFIVAIPILLANYHGSERLSYTYGMVRIGQCVLNFMTPPIAGYLRDCFKSFTFAFIYLGTLTMIGAFISVFLPLMKGKYRRSVIREVVATHERGEHFYERSRS